MMEEVVVTTALARTALGDLDQTFSGLMAGLSGAAPGFFSGPLARYPLATVAGLAGAPGSLERLWSLLDRLTAQSLTLPPETALILATTKGAVDELLKSKSGPWCGQPWDLGDELARRLKLNGQRHTVSAACASGTLALISGAQMIGQGAAKAVLVVGIDIISSFVTAGFSKLQALSAQQCRPFDAGRDGLTLGEGGAIMLLASRETAQEMGLPVLAKLSAWGAACDATHITAPDRYASGLIAALRQIVSSGCPVGGVNAHGTGTSYNDAMEMTAFRQIWPDSMPFHSVKGAIGHCLGAAGLIEAAVAIRSLHEGRIPPTVGLLNPEQDMPGVCGDQPQKLLHPSVLTCNSGFGGINGALLFTMPSALE